MEISILPTQYNEKSRHSMGFLMADNPSKALPMERLEAKLPAFTVDQPQSELYVWAQQTIEAYADNLKPPEQYAPLVSSKLFEDTELELRRLPLTVANNSDRYKMAKTGFIAAMKEAEAEAEINVLSRSKNDQGTPAHIQSLENMIDNIHNNYQKTYANINQKAAEYMKDVNTAVGKISDFIKAGSDGKINFKPKDFLESLDGVFKKYTNYKVGSDYSAGYKNWSPDNNDTKEIFSFEGDKQAKDFWESKLGDGFIVKLNGDKIEVRPNLDPIRNIYSTIANSETKWAGGDTNSQAFQSLQAAIDSQKNAVNSGVSQLLERFRQDNSTFETFIQLLVQMTKDLHQYNAGYYQ